MVRRVEAPWLLVALLAFASPALAGPPPAAQPIETPLTAPLFDPLLDGPPNPPPGFYATLEVAILRPSIKDNLTDFVPLGENDFAEVALPIRAYEWVAAPRVRLGYRLPDSFGEYVFTYRTVLADQSSVLANYDMFGNNGVLRSHLNAQAFDLDYANVSWCWNPLWDARWTIGLRVPLLFFDVSGDALLLHERITNHFIGLGPHAALEVQRHFEACPSAAIFARAEGATALGYIRQTFERVEYFPALVGGSSVETNIQYVPMIDLQFGMSWTPPTDRHWLRFTAGYEFEAWYYVGRTQGDARANLFFQGVFARGEWRY